MFNSNLTEKSSNNFYNRIKFAAIANLNSSMSSVSSNAPKSNLNEPTSTTKSKIIPIVINHMNSSDEANRRAYEQELIRRRHDMFTLIYRNSKVIMNNINIDTIDRKVDETVVDSEFNENETTTSEFELFPFDAVE